MANDIVNHFLNGEQVESVLSKLKALLELGLTVNPEDYTSSNLHGYLWTLSDLLGELEELLS